MRNKSPGQFEARGRHRWQRNARRGVLRAAFLLALLALAARPLRADLLTALAPDALVVVGDDAPDLEAKAAQRLAAALKAAGGLDNAVVKASVINADLESAASHHLLVVGTETSNRVLERLRSHWAFDRDAYYARREPYESFMPTTGHRAAGYGTFAATEPVGYVECDRNLY